jgi:sirohydrochlorin cobaltochelatase
MRALAAWLAAGENRVGELIILSNYELRHYRDATLDGLAPYDTPLAAREIALYDAAGNYRPLKTAPTLRRGWRLTLSGIEELRAALDEFYPAMLAARLAFQQGRLAVTPLRDTLNRQCRSEDGCPGCLKTILWPIAAGVAITSLPPEKFDASRAGFPLLCAEACNLLVARAREVVKQRSAP